MMKRLVRALAPGARRECAARHLQRDLLGAGDWCNMIAAVQAGTTGVKINLLLRASARRLRNHGTLAQRGIPEALYCRPESEFVAGFTAEATVFPVRLHADGTVTLGPLTLRLRHVPFAPADGVAVKGAMRPKAWRVGAHHGLAAACMKAAYRSRAREGERVRTSN